MVNYENLPEEIGVNIYHYTHEERWNNFVEVIMCLLTMHATLNGNSLAESNIERPPANTNMEFQTNINNDDTATPNEHSLESESRIQLPSAEDYLIMLEQHATFDTTDPSHKYDITSKHKLGIGGFAKVFQVIRRSDGLKCALKFIECKNDREKEMMRNEVALMNKFRDEQIVLEIFDQYDFKNRLWIFVELMEDAITPLIANLKTNYSENSCKYVLRQCLLGLKALHDKHVIHRDIKSDNILVDA